MKKFIDETIHLIKQGNRVGLVLMVVGIVIIVQIITKMLVAFWTLTVAS